MVKKSVLRVTLGRPWCKHDPPPHGYYYFCGTAHCHADIIIIGYNRLVVVAAAVAAALLCM